MAGGSGGNPRDSRVEIADQADDTRGGIPVVGDHSVGGAPVVADRSQLEPHESAQLGLGGRGFQSTEEAKQHAQAVLDGGERDQEGGGSISAAVAFCDCVTINVTAFVVGDCVTSGVTASRRGNSVNSVVVGAEHGRTAHLQGHGVGEHNATTTPTSLLRTKWSLTAMERGWGRSITTPPTVTTSSGGASAQGQVANVEVRIAGQAQVGGQTAHAKQHSGKVLATGDVDVDVFVHQVVLRVYLKGSICERECWRVGGRPSGSAGRRVSRGASGGCAW